MNKLFLSIATLLIFSSCARYPVAQIITPKGEIHIMLYDETPQHKANFIAKANAGYFNQFTFNRVIPNFVAQGGCPDTPEGFTDSAMIMPPEIRSDLKHVYGAVGMGRDDNKAMYSARCQIYIVQNKNGLPRLDGKYTVFGKVIAGMPVVDAMVQVPRDSTDTPLQPLTMQVKMIKVSKAYLKKLGY